MEFGYFRRQLLNQKYAADSLNSSPVPFLLIIHAKSTQYL